MPDDVEEVEGEIVDLDPVGHQPPPLAVVPYSPGAGEAIDLADRPKVAATIRALTDWQAEVLRPVLDELQRALIEEADTQGAYTLRYGRLEVTVDGPNVSETEWIDVPGMIRELLAAGLPADRADALATETKVWKVSRKEANRIGASEKYKAIIEAHQVRTPKKRRAGVKRVGNS